MSGALDIRMCPNCKSAIQSGVFHTCPIEKPLPTLTPYPQSLPCSHCGYTFANEHDLLTHLGICENKKLADEELQKARKEKEAALKQIAELEHKCNYRDDDAERRKEAVDHPSHYNSGKIEVIDFIDDQKLNFSRGCVVKYVSRAKHKGNELEDLKKAMWYLQHEIELVEKGED